MTLTNVIFLIVAIVGLITAAVLLSLINL